jgi:CubicO group peptidase (beta-lactamase class C family)
MRHLAAVRVAVVAAASCSFLFATPPGAAQDDPPPTKPATPTAPHPLEGFWDLRMERHVWWPYAVEGSLAVWRSPTGLRGSVTFDRMWGIQPMPVEVAPDAGDRVRFVVTAFSDVLVRVEGSVKDGVFSGEAHWDSAKPKETCGLMAERVPSIRRFEPDSTSTRFPVEADPEKVGVDPTALDRLIRYAGRYDTDALLVVKDGKLLCDRTFLRPRGPCTLESITTVVASFAIPLLVEDGKLPRDLDTPLTVWFPEWKDDARKSRITLRHVLTHTSGLAAVGTQSMQAASDCLANALKSDAVREPGTKCEYSNPAMELLSGIVAKAAGAQVDQYLAGRLLRPVGIERWRWTRDRAGNTPTYAGLDLEPADVARIGKLVADRGLVDGKRIVPEWWFDEIAEPCAVNDEVGLAWWLLRDAKDEVVVLTKERLDRLRGAGFADADSLAPLVGKSFEGRSAWVKAVHELLDEAALKKLNDCLPPREIGGEIRGRVSSVYHTGAMGQYLIVFPESKLIVVRQRRGFAENELSDYVKARAEFQDITKLALDLVPR